MTNDLTWLPNSLLKDIPEVKVEYEEETGQPYGGQYVYNSSILTVIYSDEIMSNETTIVHELCHFIQETKGRVDDNPIQWKVEGTYGDSINRFFWGSKNEMEALLWQNKYAKDQYSEWWFRKLVMRN